MKRTVIFILLIQFLLLNGCISYDTTSREVEKYIQQLKDGTYKSLDMPDFEILHIYLLLDYRDDTTTIRDFPHNPLSSYYQEECSLGVFVLWTIESIRIGEIKSDSLIGGFPSLNPELYFSNPDLYMPFNPAEAQSAAAKAYYHWWYSDAALQPTLESDPLKDSGYCWQ